MISLSLKKYAVVLGTVLPYAIAAEAYCQSILETGPDFNDPRMTELRADFATMFGGIRDLSFVVKTRFEEPSTGYRFMNYIMSPVEPAQTYGENFIRKLGGRVKADNAEFSLIYVSIGDNRDCYERNKCISSFKIKIVDNRDDTVLYSSNPRISCNKKTAKETTRRIVYCPIGDDDLHEEILLSLVLR